MELTCEQLGITKDDIAERIAANLAREFLERVEMVPLDPEEGGGTTGLAVPSKFADEMTAAVEAKVDAGIKAVVERALAGDITVRLEALTFPQTNSYGEPKRAPLTLLEYIAKRIDDFLLEPVDSEGKTGDRYSNKGRTRVTWMIDKHLDWEIEKCMKEVVKDANERIAEGIAETVKLKMADIAKALKVTVNLR